MNIAIIPARGGSKRIPRKNIRSFHGKPMIAWSVEAALNSGCFDQVWVSTDDQEIADIAITFGAKVPFLRPATFSDDFATTADVMKHAIEEFEKLYGNFPKNICCIYATAPFIQVDDLTQGLNLLTQSSADYVFSATTFDFPIQRAIRLNAEDNVEMFYPNLFNVRSQDLEEAWHDAAQFYWGTPKAWLEKIPIFSSNSKIIKLPRTRVQDIDTVDDWHYAEMMAKFLLDE